MAIVNSATVITDCTYLLKFVFWLSDLYPGVELLSPMVVELIFVYDMR